MPVPKKRHTNTRQRTRRAHWKLSQSALGKCPQCGEPVLPHHACMSCGSYKGRTVLKIETEKSKKKKKVKTEKAAKAEKTGKEGK